VIPTEAALEARAGFPQLSMCFSGSFTIRLILCPIAFVGVHALCAHSLHAPLVILLVCDAALACVLARTHTCAGQGSITSLDTSSRPGAFN
jgi:hypothetical protein